MIKSRRVQRRAVLSGIEHEEGDGADIEDFRTDAAPVKPPDRRSS